MGCEAWKYFEHFLCFLMKCYYIERRMLQPSCCSTQSVAAVLYAEHHTPACGEASGLQPRTADSELETRLVFHFFTFFFFF